MKIVLGSKSPRRREILDMVITDFSVRVSDCDESYTDDVELKDVPRILAERKALAIPMEQDELIIGADTVVIYEKSLLGKPKSKDEAVSMLKMLSGTTHEVVSGICIRTKDKIHSEAITTYVTFRELTEMEILSYVEKYNPLDKAGAYGIQEAAGAFVEKIDGDFYNVVGLPLCRLCEILKKEFDILI